MIHDTAERILEPHAAQFKPHERSLALVLIRHALREGIKQGRREGHNGLKELGEREGNR